MKINIAGLSCQGVGRDNNEDSFYIDKRENLFIVADGMGGAKAGEEASAIAVKAVRDFITRAPEDKSTVTVLRGAVEMANEVVYRHAFDDTHSGMATTLVVVLVRDDELYVAHVGDSRLYRIRNAKVEQLTCDHSLVQRLVDEGSLSADEMKSHPKKNVLTRAIGAESIVDVDIAKFDMQDKDVYIMCTDGMSNHTDEQFMLYVQDTSKDAQMIAERLVFAARENGSNDDTTVIVLSVEQEVSEC